MLGSTTVAGYDCVPFPMPKPTPNPAIPVEVLLEDPDFVVVLKPTGLVSEPGLGHAADSVLNGAFARWGDRLGLMGEPRDHGLVHRLDRDASGALVIALSPAAYDGIRAQFEARTVRKRYLAIVEGKPPRGEGTCELPIEEARRGDMKIAVVGRRGAARPALTRWRTLASTKARTLLEVEIETGRLHQIRAHFDHIGFPVLNDKIYGKNDDHFISFIDKVNQKSNKIGRHCLHSSRLSFELVGGSEAVMVEIPLANDLESIWSDALPASS